jgi:hypothetical protein
MRRNHLRLLAAVLGIWNIGVAAAATVSSLNPSAAAAGSGNLTLTVIGSGFFPTGVVCPAVCGSICPGPSRIIFGTTQLATIYVSSTELRTTIPASSLLTVRTVDVSERHIESIQCQSSSDVSSNAVPFTITSATTLNLTCSPASGQVGVPFSGTCTPSGGTAPYTWSIGAGFGLTINATGGVSGTPSQTGLATVTVRDASSPPLLKTFDISIAPAALNLTCSPTDGQTGVPFSGTCIPSGGTAPYTWSISSGFGLSINAAGVISGTPAQAGTVTVTVRDAGTPQQSKTFTLSIALSTASIGVSPPSGPQGTTFTITGSGFTPNGTVVRSLRGPGASATTQISSLIANASGQISSTWTSACGDATGDWTVSMHDVTKDVSSNQVTLTVTPGQCQSTMTCQMDNLTARAVRAEGQADLAADVVVRCSGGTPAAAGAAIAPRNIAVSLSAPVTSRNYGGGLSEALLLLDEPAPANQRACQPAPCAITGTGNGAGVYSGAPGRPNIFQGRIAAGNTIVFDAVPLDAGAHTLRITNLRMDGNAVAPARVGQVSRVTASVSSNGLTIFNQPQPVGDVRHALGFQATLTQERIAAQCDPVSTPSTLGTLRFMPLAPFAFRTRTTAFDASGNSSPTPAAQNVPGAAYASESGFYNPALGGALNTAGLAEYGTRLKATFRNIPTGVQIWVATRVLTAAGSVRLVNAQAGPFSPVSGSQVIDGSEAASLTVSAGQAEAVWEVLSTNGTASFDLPAWFSFAGTPALGSLTVTGSYAPAGTGFTAIPRFADLGSAVSLLKVGACNPTLSTPILPAKPPFCVKLPIGGGTPPYFLNVSGPSGFSIRNGDQLCADAPQPGLHSLQMQGVDSASRPIATILSVNVPAPTAAVSCRVQPPPQPALVRFEGLTELLRRFFEHDRHRARDPERAGHQPPDREQHGSRTAGRRTGIPAGGSERVFRPADRCQNARMGQHSDQFRGDTAATGQHPRGREHVGQPVASESRAGHRYDFGNPGRFRHHGRSARSDADAGLCQYGRGLRRAGGVHGRSPSAANDYPVDQHVPGAVADLPGRRGDRFQNPDR